MSRKWGLPRTLDRCFLVNGLSLHRTRWVLRRRFNLFPPHGPHFWCKLSQNQLSTGSERIYGCFTSFETSESCLQCAAYCLKIHQTHIWTSYKIWYANYTRKRARSGAFVTFLSEARGKQRKQHPEEQAEYCFSQTSQILYSHQTTSIRVVNALYLWRSEQNPEISHFWSERQLLSTSKSSNPHSIKVKPAMDTVHTHWGVTKMSFYPGISRFYWRALIYLLSFSFVCIILIYFFTSNNKGFLHIRTLAGVLLYSCRK